MVLEVEIAVKKFQDIRRLDGQMIYLVGAMGSNMASVMMKIVEV